MNPNHLTTEQLYQLLDDPNHTTGTHLHLCAQCRHEVSALRASLSGFRDATLALAAAQLEARPLAPPRPASRPRFAPAGMSLQFFAASCATALAVIATSLSLLVPHRAPAPNAAPAGSTAAARAASDSDDALLNGIAQDLSAPVPPSLAPLQVAAPNSSINQQN
jgi:hypothetical protein